jgi:hypothetical protein
VDFVHQGPTFDAGSTHIMPQVASMGAAVPSPTSIATAGRTSTSPTAARAASIVCIATRATARSPTSRSVGVADVNQPDRRVDGRVWGDYDNDGWEDLLPVSLRPARAVSQRQGRASSPVGDAAVCRVGEREQRDVARLRPRRPLDLFIAGYWPTDVNLWKLETTKIMPESFEYANNGGASTCCTIAATARSRTYRRARHHAAALDAGGRRGRSLRHGLSRSVLSNDYGVSELFANRRRQAVRRRRARAGVGRSPKSGMNASVGDVFNDGRLAIYKTNISEPACSCRATTLWVPKGPKAPTYENLASSWASISAAGAGARSSAI